MILSRNSKIAKVRRRDGQVRCLLPSQSAHAYRYQGEILFGPCKTMQSMAHGGDRPLLRAGVDDPSGMQQQSLPGISP